MWWILGGIVFALMFMPKSLRSIWWWVLGAIIVTSLLGWWMICGILAGVMLLGVWSIYKKIRRWYERNLVHHIRGFFVRRERQKILRQSQQWERSLATNSSHAPTRLGVNMADRMSFDHRNQVSVIALQSTDPGIRWELDRAAQLRSMRSGPKV